MTRNTMVILLVIAALPSAVGHAESPTVQGLVDRVDALERTLSGALGRLGVVEAQAGNNHARIAGVEASLAALSDQLDAVDADLGLLEDRVVGLAAVPRVVTADSQLVGRGVGFEVAEPGGGPSLRFVVLGPIARVEVGMQTSVPGFFSFLRAERGLRHETLRLYDYNLSRLEQIWSCH